MAKNSLIIDEILKVLDRVRTPQKFRHIEAHLVLMGYDFSTYDVQRALANAKELGLIEQDEKFAWKRKPQGHKWRVCITLDGGSRGWYAEPFSDLIEAHDVVAAALMTVQRLEQQVYEHQILELHITIVEPEKRKRLQPSGTGTM